MSGNGTCRVITARDGLLVSLSRDTPGDSPTSAVRDAFSWWRRGGSWLIAVPGVAAVWMVEPQGLTVAVEGEAAGLVEETSGRCDAADWSRFLDRHLERAICVRVSIMTGGAQIRHALAMVREAKSREHCPPVVFGGPHVNVLAEQTARHELVDLVLAGPEGEHGFSRPGRVGADSARERRPV